MHEISFDGLIGPSHNYAGLSFGNIAATSNAGDVSHPKAAALQGLTKMRTLLGLGPHQGFLPPQMRPNVAALRGLGFGGDDAEVCASAWSADPALLRNAMSASCMWTANAATVSPAPDTRDGRCHLSVANLSTMLHRGFEAPATELVLRHIFPDARHFAVHSAVTPRLGDEGAANHMRMGAHHGARGIEIFVYGEQQPGGFPARQDIRASQAVARRHWLDPQRCFFAQQSHAAIAAGAFHNDVVAVANGPVLFAHEQAFEDKQSLYAFIAAQLPEAEIIEVPAAQVSLADAISSYLFNSQLVTQPDGTMALIVPKECSENEAVWRWLNSEARHNSAIRDVKVIDVRESMRNGGGPACLRLRVVVDDAALATINPRFLLDDKKISALEAIVAAHWPESIAPDDLGSPALWAQCWAAHRALMEHLGL